MLRMIEVKGRVEGVDTVIVSHNEVLCALNQSRRVHPRHRHGRREYHAHDVYQETVRQPARLFGDEHVYDIAKLKRTGEVILEKEETWQ